VKFTSAPGATHGPAGVIETAIGMSCTEQLADLVGSAWDVAVTVTEACCEITATAVYSPVELMVPQKDQGHPERLQVTAVLDDPVTVAVS